jgi:hypothetical protein
VNDLIGLITATNAGTAATTAIAVGAVWMVLTGRLITARQHNEVREDRDKWHTAYEQSQATRGVTEQQVGQLLDGHATTLGVLRTIQDLVDREAG